MHGNPTALTTLGYLALQCFRQIRLCIAPSTNPHARASGPAMSLTAFRSSNSNHVTLNVSSHTQDKALRIIFPMRFVTRLRSRCDKDRLGQQISAQLTYCTCSSNNAARLFHHCLFAMVIAYGELPDLFLSLTAQHVSEYHVLCVMVACHWLSGCGPNSHAALATAPLCGPRP
jgi:hypothetical protein